MQPNTEHREKSISELTQLISVGDVAMLVTHAKGRRLRSRPMETAGINDAGEIFFLTSSDAQFIDQVTESNYVGLCYARTEAADYLSVSGVAQLLEDRKLIASLWQEDYRRWVPDGLDDPSLTLLKVTAFDAEHWGTTGKVNQITRLVMYGRGEPKEFHETLA